MFTWYYLFVVVIPSFTFQMGAKKAYRKFKHYKGTAVNQTCRSATYQCCLCGVSSNSFQLLPIEEQERENPCAKDSNLDLSDEVN
jgi:hypothetical protein